MSTASTAIAEKQNAKQQFLKISDEYFDQVYYPHQPTAGTTAGFHQYDTQLENFSRKSIDAEIAALQAFEKRIAAIPPAPLDQITRADREIVLGQIHSRLLTLQTIRPWAKNADKYSSTCANGAFTLMERKFASPDDRLRSLIAREKQMPALLAEARVNLQNPPRIFTEIAIEQLPGIIASLSTMCRSPSQTLTMQRSSRVRAVQRRRDRSSQELSRLAQDRSASAIERRLPHRRGDLLKEVALRRDGRRASRQASRDRLGRYAQTISSTSFRFPKNSNPTKDNRAVLEQLGHNHPAPDTLLNAFRATFDGLLGFIRSHHIVTIPPMCGPSLKRRHPSCAPPPLPAWIRPVPSKRMQPIRFSTSRFRTLP